MCEQLRNLADDKKLTPAILPPPATRANSNPVAEALEAVIALSANTAARNNPVMLMRFIFLLLLVSGATRKRHAPNHAMRTIAHPVPPAQARVFGPFRIVECDRTQGRPPTADRDLPGKLTVGKGRAISCMLLLLGALAPVTERGPGRFSSDYGAPDVSG